MAEAKGQAGRQFDPDLVPVLIGELEHDGIDLDEDVPTGSLLPAV